MGTCMRCALVVTAALSVSSSLQAQSGSQPGCLSPAPLTCGTTALWDDAEPIRILVLYTPEVAAIEGTEIISRSLDEAESFTNTAFGNSLATSRVRVVAVREAPPDQSGTPLANELDAAVTSLVTRSADPLDPIAILRDTFGADVIMAVTEFAVSGQTSPCGDIQGFGINSICGRETGVVGARPGLGIMGMTKCALEFQPRIFAHELGHVMGLLHSDAHHYLPLCDPAAICNGFQTLMAQSGQNNPGFCPQLIPFFSNPLVTDPCSGMPLGSQMNNSVILLNQTGPLVANYRQFTDLNSDSTPDEAQELSCLAAAIAPPYDIVEFSDFTILTQSIGYDRFDPQYEPLHDIDGDGSVTAADAIGVANLMGNTCAPGCN